VTHLGDIKKDDRLIGKTAVSLGDEKLDEYTLKAKELFEKKWDVKVG
jgi:hypothetical protein